MNYEFKFPDIGEGIHEGKVLQWKAQIGDTLKVGDILVIVETDKVVAEIPSPRDGKLVKQMAMEGQIIHVGEILVVIETEGAEATPEVIEEASTVIGQLETSKGMVLPSSGEGVYDKSPESISLLEPKEVVLATPVARKMAKDMNVDISKIIGTGPAGRIMKQDILKTAQQPKKEIPPEVKKETTAFPVRSIKTQIEGLEFKSSILSTVRNTIANNMEISHQIPVATFSDYIEIDGLVDLRKNLNKDEDHFTFTPILIKILASALKKYPLLNSHYDPIKKEIKTFDSINIGLAVDTDSGLVVPTLRNVERKSINELNDEIKALTEKTLNRTISLEELRSGTISVTNYGSFGGVFGSPIINPPQVAIIGIGRIHKAPYVKNDTVVASYVLPVSVVFDHRVIDGAYAGKFLTYFLGLANSPEKLFVSL
jgi:pyruvate dehydrogenase E2 component (dihydrolipoamide acetyltransferase)